MAVPSITYPKVSGQVITSADMNDILEAIQEGTLDIGPNAVNMTVQGSDPSGGDLVEGLLWYLGSSDKLRYRTASATRTVANLEEAQTFAALLTLSGGIATNTVSEATGGSGVTIDGLLIKDGYIEMTEQAAPSSPAANKVRLYAKDSGGTSALFYKDDAGNEHGVGGESYDAIDVSAFPASGTIVYQGNDNLVVTASTVPAPGYAGIYQYPSGATVNQPYLWTTLGYGVAINAVNASGPFVPGHRYSIKGTYVIPDVTATGSTAHYPFAIGMAANNFPSISASPIHDDANSTIETTRDNVLGAMVVIDTAGNILSASWPNNGDASLTDSTYNYTNNQVREFEIIVEVADPYTDESEFTVTVKIEDNTGTIRTLLNAVTFTSSDITEVDLAGATMGVWMNADATKIRTFSKVEVL